MTMKTHYRPEAKIGVGGFEIGEQEKLYLNQVIESNRLSYGPFSEKLESLFAKEHDCKYSVFCNSGTSALHIALAVLKDRYQWQDGDEVIVPAITFIATSNIVLHNNMKPVFVDVAPITYNINPKLIEKHISDKTRAIIPVHLFGLPCDMTPIVEISRKYGLRIIEDSCETMFATYKGKKVGSFGDIGCFSTYMAHLLVTGVGGFATTNDDDLATTLKSLMNHGRDSIYLNIDDDEEMQDKTSLFEIVNRRFSFVHLGYSFRATELEAAIGLGQFEKRGEIIKARQENAQYLTDGLRDLEDLLQLPHVPPDFEHVFMMYPIVMRHSKKNGLVIFLEENKIETRDMLPLISQPIYIRLFGDIEKEFPVAQWINSSGFYIGCHQYLGKSELDYIIEKIYEYLKQ